MTGRRRTRSTFLPRTGRSKRPAAAGSVRTRTATLLATAALLTGCGALPGTDDADDAPVVVMTWAPQDTGATNKPGMPAFAEAYARWINANGGLDGRQLKVLTCNDHNDTVGAATCARTAVKEGAVAVVGSYSQYAQSFFPPLEGAGIPYIGGYGISESEFTSPLSYPVNGGQPALLAGLGEELARTCGRVVLVRPDTIAGDTQPVMLDAGLETGSHPASKDQLAAEDAAEYTTVAEAALRGANGGTSAKKGCVVPALGDRTSIFMDSFRRVREEYPQVRTASVLGSVDQTEIDSTGGAEGPYEGSYVTGWYPVASDRRWDDMKKIIKEEAFSDTRIEAEDTGVQTTYLAFTVLRQAIASMKGEKVTADSLKGALDHGLKVDTGGLTPALNWEFSGRLGSVGFPRMVNANVTLQVVRNGRLVAARTDFVDVTKSLQAASLR